ncbi:MAG: ATP-binding cassette domain-containing protein [Nitriliruptoraceae bacterium]
MWELRGVWLTHPLATSYTLQNVKLRIDNGEQVVVLGSSGAGKSTLLRCLAGDLAPTHGTLSRNSIDVYASDTARKGYLNNVAMIRQTGDLVPRLTARSNLLVAVASQWRLTDLAQIVLRRSTRFDADVLALAKTHGVSHLMASPVERLSGGERQRIALLQALLRQPQLILADEPTTGLDPATATAALEALRAVTDVTLVVATHDLTVAATFPRMVAIKNGLVVHDGAPLTSHDLAELYAADLLE